MVYISNNDLISDDEKIYVPIRNKIIDQNINIDEEIPIEVINNNVFNANTAENFYKDAWLLSLYNQVEFLRKECDEKNAIIKSFTIRNSKACSETEFLRKELEEKNFLIRTLTIRDSQVYAGVFNEVTGLNQGYENENETLKESGNEIGEKTKVDSTPNNTISSTTTENSDINKQLVESEFDDTVNRRKIQQQWVDEQLALIRELKHQTFLNNKRSSPNREKGGQENIEENEKISQSISNDDEESNDDSKNEIILWPENTVLITGDSMLHGVEEKRISRKFNVKVRTHPGAKIKDMYDHLNPYLRKKPKYLILHIGTNDASIQEKTSDVIFDEILQLKRYAESKVPDIKVTISCPIIRLDNSLANLKIVHLNQKLKTENVSVIQNENIKREHLGKMGLHMIPRGTARMAMNFIAFIKHL